MAVDNLRNAQLTMAKVLYCFLKEAVRSDFTATDHAEVIKVQVRTKDNGWNPFNDCGTYNEVCFGVELKDGRVREWELDNYFKNGTTREFELYLDGEYACYADDIKTIWIRKQRPTYEPGMHDSWYPEWVKVTGGSGSRVINYTMNINQRIEENTGFQAEISVPGEIIDVPVI